MNVTKLQRIDIEVPAKSREGSRKILRPTLGSNLTDAYAALKFGSLPIDGYIKFLEDRYVDDSRGIGSWHIIARRKAVGSVEVTYML